MVGFEHLLPYGFIIAAFQGVTYIQYALDFFDDIFCTHVVFFGYVRFYFVQHVHVAIAQEFYFRMILLDGSHYIFAALAAFVIS